MTIIKANIDKLTFVGAKRKCKETAINKGNVWHVTLNEDGLWLVVVDGVLARNNKLKSYYSYEHYGMYEGSDKVIKAEWHEKIFARL